MDKRVRQQLEKMVIGFEEYQWTTHPKSSLDPQREISEASYEGITEIHSKTERLITVRQGKAAEIDIAKRQETKFDYGDFKNQLEPGEPIQKHLRGDEEAVIIVRSEFSSKPKGPHAATKVIEVFE